MKTCIIIQSRTTSTRFKEKVFHKIKGINVVEYVIKECLLSKADDVILAVPKSQLKQFKFLKKRYKIKLFGGSENNLLKRYYKSAKKYKADIVVRITSDCPLISHKNINDAVDMRARGCYDYCINTSLDTSYKNKKNDEIEYITNTYVSDGFDVEVFTFDALKNAYNNAKTLAEKEHMTIWMKENLKCGISNNLVQIIDGKFSLDEKKDLGAIKNFLILKEKGFIKIGEKGK